MTIYDMPAVDLVTLDWVKVAVAARVSAEFADDARLDIRREAWNNLVYKLSSHVLTDKLPPETITERKTFRFEVPASPWQQFKATHAHRWWMRSVVARRPVRMVEHLRIGELVVNLERFHAYPQAKVAKQLGQARQGFNLTREVRWDEVWPVSR